MDKKVKFSDKTTVAKIVYAAVIAILCISAIVVGIVAAASKKENIPDDTEKPPVTDGTENEGGEGEKPDATTFISPVVGEVVKGHSLDTPVFSDTLGEWRIHTGIDICTAEGADVYAASGGTVSAVYDHPRLGHTVEITHASGIVTCYSNLAKDAVSLEVGKTVQSGEKIGAVGDSSIAELAEEAHLHFEIKVNGSAVNPLDYISEDSKKASLGITEA